MTLAVDVRKATSEQEIRLADGAGGSRSRQLISEVILPLLGGVHSGRMEDSALLELDTRSIALTTDSFVVDPIFFGNGDIGKLAVCGTVNDLAVSGATPRFLTLSLILEEGLALSDLTKIITSIRVAAEEADVEVVAGDTKVVRKGEIDKICINTAGVGEVDSSVRLGIAQVAPGDAVIVTGNLGDHSIHLLSLREGLGFENRIFSDCAPLAEVIFDALAVQPGAIHCIRDVTRGGLATVLNEVADDGGLSIHLNGAAIPIQAETIMAADMLGVDPLHLANEGCLCMFIESAAVEDVLASLREHPASQAANVVGTVSSRGSHAVSLRAHGQPETAIETLDNADLPRLC